MRIKNAGKLTGLPVEHTTHSPTYSSAAMFPQIPTFDIVAMSTGNDYITFNARGELEPVNDAWIAMCVSLDKGTEGLPNSMLEAHAGTTGSNMGGDLFGHYVDGSASIPDVLLGTDLWLEQLATEIGVGEDHEIDALDLFLALREDDPQMTSDMEWKFDRFYFVISHATLDNVPATWWGTPANKSQSTILVMTWSSTGWSQPTVWKTRHDLGLLEDDRIDALAVDNRNRTQNETYIYSTEYNVFRVARQDPILDPLLVTRRPNGPPVPTPLLDRTGDPISRRLKIKPGNDNDVTGLCDYDPGNELPWTIPGPEEVLPHMQSLDTLGLSVWHRGVSEAVLTFSGWEGGPENGVLNFFVFLNRQDIDINRMPDLQLWRSDQQDAVEVRFPFMPGYGMVWVMVTFTPIANPGQQLTPYMFRFQM